MSPEARQKLKGLLLKHESFKPFVYTDTTHHLTIGIGRNLSDRGISQDEALILLDDDIFYFSSKLSTLLPYFDKFDDNRKICIVDLCFNLGIRGLLGFKEMLAALERKDYESAATEILNSKGATQCVERYQELAYIMRTGEL
jgi:lysozyme